MGIVRGTIHAAFAIALLTVTLACDDSRAPDETAIRAGAAPPNQEVNLARAVSLAEAVVETRSIDFGRPAARPLLREGWSRDGEGSNGSTWVAIVGGHATLTLFSADGGPRSLLLRVRPVPKAGAPPPRMNVAVNDTRVAALALSRGLAPYRVSIPGGVLRAGANELAFDVDDPEDGAGAGAPRGRPPSVRFYTLGLSGGPPPTEARARGDALELPDGARLEYSFHLAPGAALRIAGISSLDGAADGSLVVEVDRDTGRIADARWSAGETPPPLAIPLEESDHVRVALSASAGGIRVEGAEISESIPASADLPPAPAQPRSGARPNVIIYLVDTLRADHLGAYGYERPVSPAIDSLAAGGVTFLEARANSSWTRPSAATVLTGLLPRTHGAVGRRDAMPEAVTTLAERLQQRGYATAGFVTNGNTATEFGFGQGFAVYERMNEKATRPTVHVRSGRLHRKVLRWLDRRKDARPFFLYVHASDPHAPYTPPAETLRALAPRAPNLHVGSLAFLRRLRFPNSEVDESLRRDVITLYDAEIAALDANFGRFLAALEERAALADSLVIFTSDHGEEFAEHGGWQHGQSVYGEQLRVPLIVRFPDGRHAGERSTLPVEHTDIAPTVLEAAGLTPDPALPGRGLGERLARGGSASRPLYSSLAVDGLHMESLEIDGLKLVEYGCCFPGETNVRPVELFDLKSDPGEQRNLARERPVTTGYLRQQLRVYREGIAEPLGSARGSVDAETEEALRALGYIDE